MACDVVELQYTPLANNQKIFIMLALLILGFKDSVTLENFDVY
jgi:hypothetical protein